MPTTNAPGFDQRGPRAADAGGGKAAAEAAAITPNENAGSAENVGLAGWPIVVGESARRAEHGNRLQAMMQRGASTERVRSAADPRMTEFRPRKRRNAATECIGANASEHGAIARAKAAKRLSGRTSAESDSPVTFCRWMHE